MKIVLVLLSLPFFLFACSETPSSEKLLPAVKVVKVGTLENSCTQERNFSFIAEPYRTTSLSFRVGGPVCTFTAQNGQFFKKGELIAAIDNRDFVIRKERAEAVLAHAESEYRRIHSLYQRNNLSATSYEKAKADYEKARADYRDAENALADTRLTAPFDGYVQEVHIERFQDVKPSAPVVTFIDISLLKAEVYVPEALAVSLKNDSEKACTLSFESLSGKTFAPLRTYLTHSTTNNNISYLFTAVIENKDYNLFGGMAGSLSFSFAPLDTLSLSKAIPQTAVCHSAESGSYVWKIDADSVAHRVPVILGDLHDNNQVEIVSGVDKGDHIAVTSMSNLKDGQKIRLLN